MFAVSKTAPAASNASAAAAILHAGCEREFTTKSKNVGRHWRTQRQFDARFLMCARVDELKRAFNQRVQSEDSPIIVSSASTLIISVDRNVLLVYISRLMTQQKINNNKKQNFYSSSHMPFSAYFSATVGSSSNWRARCAFSRMLRLARRVSRISFGETRQKAGDRRFSSSYDVATLKFAC